MENKKWAGKWTNISIAMLTLRFVLDLNDE